MPADLHLLRPLWLWALLPLAILWVWLAYQGRSRRGWEDLVDPHLRDAVLSGDGRARLAMPLLVLGLGWTLLIAALAGPVRHWESRPVYRIEQPRVLVLDLSAAMDDTGNGVTSLERARFEVMDLLRSADEGQTALIGYGSEPFVIAPLTTDAATILEQVPVLAPDLLPTSGVGRADLALDMAASLLRRSGAAGGDVILIAGGLSRPAAARAAAARLRADGHRLSVLAVDRMSAFDALVRVGGGLLLYARPDDADTKRLLALAGHGALTPSGEPIATEGQWRDGGYWLLIPVLPLAALAFRRGWLGLLPIALLLLPPSPARAWSWQDLWFRPDQQALQMLDGDLATEAVDRLPDARWRAAAFYRAGRYQEALAALAGRSGAEAHYNRGNTLARLGRYEDAVAEYEAALLIDPDHADAQYNRDLLLRRFGPGRESGAIDTVDAFDSAADDPPADSAAADPADAPKVRAGLDHAAAPVGGDQATGTDRSPPPRAVSGTTDNAADTGTSAGPNGRSRPRTRGTPAATPTAPRSVLPTDASATARSGAFDDTPGAHGASGRSNESSTRTVGADEQVTDDPPPRVEQRTAATPGSERRPGDPVPTAEEAAQADSGQDPVDALLRQVPDDPAGLLRERLMLQYLRRHGLLP